MYQTENLQYILNPLDFKPSRFRELDGLSGLAVLAVVVYHFGATYNDSYLSAPVAPYSFRCGELGVQLFFIISGFLILLMAIDARSARVFITSRFSRYYPAYWFSLLLAGGD